MQVNWSLFIHEGNYQGLIHKGTQGSNAKHKNAKPSALEQVFNFPN